VSEVRTAKSLADAIAAREAARSRLVQQHAAEYRVLLNIERRKRGLGDVKL
jgi:hypothetical protein